MRRTMYLRAFLLSISSFCLVTSLSWAGAQETAVPTSTANWSPVPTRDGLTNAEAQLALKRATERKRYVVGK